MNDHTGIEWTDSTWNPVTGCTKVSAGCKFCYAERIFQRPYPGRPFTDVRMHDDRLEQPLSWRKPRRIFVNSMSDLFHEDVDDIFLKRVFAVMAIAQRHTFQILTKRSGRMRSWMSEGARATEVFDHVRNSEIGYRWGGADLPPLSWPLPNVWLGVSVENQEMVDQRIPSLLRTPATVHFLSCEPLLGPIDLAGLTHYDAGKTIRALDWVIAGGESGPRARPASPTWFRSLRDQCAIAGIPFFFKQWGEWAPAEAVPADLWRGAHTYIDDHFLMRMGKRIAGRELDGATHAAMPRLQ